VRPFCNLLSCGRFHQLMQEKKVGQLTAWIEEAKNSKIPELRAFVRI
jgi:transposase